MIQIKKAAIGLGVSALLTVLLLAVGALLVLRAGVLPQRWCGMVSTAVGGVSVLLASLLTARLTGERGLLHGTVVAACYAFLFSFAAVFLTERVDLAAVALRAVVFLLCGAVGGVCGVSRKSRVRF